MNDGKGTGRVCPQCGYGNRPTAEVCNLCHEVLASPAPRDSARHLLLRGGGEPIELSGRPRLTIGRMENNDIAIPSRSVSRLHAEIRWEDGEPVLRDRSSNGTLVNGRPVERCVLQQGDSIRIGPFQCEYVVRTGQEDTLGIDPMGCTQASADPSLLGVIKGDALVEQLQTIERTRKTGTLHVFGIGRGRRGWIAIRHGLALAAGLDQLNDAQAVLAMLALADGRFVMTPEVAVTERRIESTITGLLFEASRLQDESQLVR